MWLLFPFVLYPAPFTGKRWPLGRRLADSPSTHDALPLPACSGSERCRLYFAVGLALAGLCRLDCVAAQPRDDFDDGDFLHSPAWSGDVDRWQIGRLNGSALQSMGIAAADTIYLATESGDAFGRWQITFAHEAVNLSAFNGARIFFVSDRSDTRAEAAGYYLQLGTNNADRISLWRTDGDLRTGRTELGRSDDALVPGDSSLVHLTIDRDTGGTFRVYANDSLLFSAGDSRYASSTHFVIWVKHTAQGAESFLFDDIGFEPVAEEHSPAPSPRARDLVLNEIHFDPAPGGSEFIEIFNRSDTSFEASRLRIRDARSSDASISSTSTMLEPGSFLVVAQDSAAFATEFRTVPFIPIRNWPALNNSGDIVVLSTSTAMIDSLAFDGSVGIKGRSLERIDPDGPTDGFNYTPSVDGFGSTPGARNSVYSVDVSPPGVRFVDQVDSTSLHIYFSEPVQTESIGIRSIEYEETVQTVQPLTATIVRLSLASPPRGPTLRLLGVRDHKGNTVEHIHAPIAFLGGAGDLVVNEIMYEPRNDPYDGLPDQVEFIECINVSDRLISVTHLLRTREVDESGDADTLRLGQDLTAIEPGGMLVITATDSAAVRSAYPNTVPEPTAVYAVAPGLTLLNGGDRLRIHNRVGTVLDELRYEPSWHHPDRSDRRGSSLERVDPKTSSRIPANWSSSVSLDGGSPGAANSIAFHPLKAGDRFGIAIEPSPFSPDGDGVEDVAFINYLLPGPTSNIRVRIFDVNGLEVRRLVPAELTGSAGSILWDGRDDAGNLLRLGIYIVLFESAGPQGGGTNVYKRPIVLARRL